MAAVNLGNMYASGTPATPADSNECARWTTIAADQGNALAAYNLAKLFEDGDRVPKDGPEAVRRFVQGAVPGPTLVRMPRDPRRWRGHPMCQTKLGDVCRDGRYGIGRDFGAALQWFRLAADQGYARAQNGLGRMYENGEGVPPNHHEAVRLYRLAADQGDRYGKANLERLTSAL
jgi:TPR repeat protein